LAAPTDTSGVARYVAWSAARSDAAASCIMRQGTTGGGLAMWYLVHTKGVFGSEVFFTVLEEYFSISNTAVLYTE
jgi:hypothetical protein